MATSMTMKLKPTQAWPIVRAAFPGYMGRKFTLTFQPTITFHDTNWDGGSRNRYAVVTADGSTNHLRVPSPWDNNIDGQTVTIPDHVMVVEHSIFCGKDCGITIYANLSHLPKWLA